MQVLKSWLSKATFDSNVSAKYIYIYKYIFENYFIVAFRGSNGIVYCSEKIWWGVKIRNFVSLYLLSGLFKGCYLANIGFLPI